MVFFSIVTKLRLAWINFLMKNNNKTYFHMLQHCRGCCIFLASTSIHCVLFIVHFTALLYWLRTLMYCRVQKVGRWKGGKPILNFFIIQEYFVGGTFKYTVKTCVSKLWYLSFLWTKNQLASKAYWGCESCLTSLPWLTKPYWVLLGLSGPFGSFWVLLGPSGSFCVLLCPSG